MKQITLILIAVVFASTKCYSQRFFTREGITEFSASEDTFEPVEAKSRTTTVIVDVAKGDIIAQVFIASFEFKNALMQEHFNENYMESSLFPKAIFRGTINGFSENNQQGRFELSGTLTIRDIERKIHTDLLVEEVNGSLVLSAKFAVLTEDFNIKIPSIVKGKIAEKVIINLNYELQEK